MKQSVTSLLLLSLLCGGALITSLPALAEEKPETAGAPRMGGLPVEDPTLKQPIEAAGPATQRGPEGGEPNEAPPSGEGAGESLAPADDSPVSAMPVEDPTLLPVEEAPSEERPTDEEPTEEEAKDAGPNVQVAYSDQFQLAINDWFFLTLDGLIQFRYTINRRQIPPIDEATMEQEKNMTVGFDVARARFTMGIGLTEFVALVMRIGVVAGGDFSFQRAFIDLKWKHFRLRGGVFLSEIAAESLINPNDLLFADYTIVDNVYSPGSSKGLMFTYIRERFSANFGYTDGLRTGFAEIRAPVNADYAFTARGQYAWGEGGLAGFNRLGHVRGTPFGVRLGGAVHYQSGGRTQGTAPVTVAEGTIDLSIRGDGWSALLSAIAGQNTSDVDKSEVRSGGLTVMGGYYVLKNLQTFAQYSVAFKPSVRGTPDPMDPLSGPLNNFHSIGAGLAYLVLPNHDNVKLIGDFQYFIGSEAGSLVPASDLNSIAPNQEGNQWALRIQLGAGF